MNAGLTRCYHMLPPPMQTAVATAWGFRLRRWRYGADTDTLVADALARERWNPAAWQRWQDERLAFVLQRAATQVPHYRRLMSAGPRPLDRWPVLSKSELRDDPRAFVADDCDPARMYHEHTSGTSGTPLDLWWSRDTVRQWYALFEARCRLWHGVSRHDRWGIFGGQLVAPFSRMRPPFWVWNGALNQLYLSSYHLAAEFVPAYLDALERHRVEYVLGYPSALHAVADEALRLGRRVPMRVVVTNAEPLYPHQRETIAAAFECPVRETYGMAEIVAAASECEHGRLHLWPEVGFIELSADDESHDGERGGELLATGLLNADMPLIRYAAGDRVTLPGRDTPCGCGRTLPTLLRVDGRADDVLYTADGRSVGRLDPVFKSALPIREAQIIQESLRQIRVRVVPAPGFGPAAAAELTRALQRRLGTVSITIEETAAIPRTAAGKFRAVICAIPPEDRPRAAEQVPVA
jgi:phenylacetate-CoA ligase